MLNNIIGITIIISIIVNSVFITDFIKIEKYIFTIKRFFQVIRLQKLSQYRIIINFLYMIYSILISLIVVLIVKFNGGLILFKERPSNLNTILLTLTSVTVLAINISFLSFLQHHKRYSKGVNVMEILSLAYSSDKAEGSKFFLVQFSFFVISSIMYCIHITWKNLYIYFFAFWQVLFVVILLIICLNIITDFNFMMVINRINNPEYKLQYNGEVNSVFEYYYYYLLKKDINNRDNNFSEYFNNQLNKSAYTQANQEGNREILFSLILVAFNSLNNLIYNKLPRHKYHKNTYYYKMIRTFIEYIISKMTMYHYCVESHPYRIYIIYMTIINNLYSYSNNIFKKVFIENNNYKYLIPTHILGLYWNYYEWYETNKDIVKDLNKRNKFKWIPFQHKNIIRDLRNDNLRKKMYSILFRKEFEFLREVTKLTPYKERDTKYRSVYKFKYRNKLFKQMGLIDESLLNKYEKEFNIYK